VTGRLWFLMYDEDVYLFPQRVQQGLTVAIVVGVAMHLTVHALRKLFVCTEGFYFNFSKAKRVKLKNVFVI